MARVAGVDRWREGWAVAQLDGDDLRLWSAASVDELIESFAAFEVVAIDMPIALAKEGSRDGEAALRKALGRSARSVFTSPTRAGVEAATQAEATQVNRAHGGPGISAQAFGLFASIREVRQALGNHPNAHWWETHPETAFALMNGGTPLESKRTALGVTQRLDLLRREFTRFDPALSGSPPRVPIDDVLDALAALWSARRIAGGIDVHFGPAPDARDDQGFALGIRI